MADSDRSQGAPSRARQTLDLVLAEAEDTMGSRLQVLDSWVESDDTFCLVFTSHVTPLEHDPIGLRRTVDEGWSVEQVADYVLVSELGEPLGSLADDLELEDGIWWFTGDRQAWRRPLS